LETADDGEIRYFPKGDYTNLDAYETVSDHGRKVMSELFRLAPEATFYTYRVTDGRIPKAKIMEAIDDATEDGCHLINMSLGVPARTDTPEHMFVCGSARDAFERGSLLVAAAGDRNKGPKMACPAVSEFSVGVGGLVAKCNGKYFGDIPADGSYWMETDEKTLKMCGFQDCNKDAHGQTCDRNQELRQWEANPVFELAEPDTLAPITWPIRGEDNGGGIVISAVAGTSHSAPVVTSSLACVLSDIQEYPTNSEIKEGISETNRRLPEVPYEILDHSKLKSRLS